MIIPVRCMTCGSMIGSKYLRYQQYINELSGTTMNKHNYITQDVSDLLNDTVEKLALDNVGLTRYCCRRHLLTHTDTIDLL
jgi:DNA-directed RNA polymerase I, II, and III subunit RPABC5